MEIWKRLEDDTEKWEKDRVLVVNSDENMGIPNGYPLFMEGDRLACLSSDRLKVLVFDLNTYEMVRFFCFFLSFF